MVFWVVTGMTVVATEALEPLPRVMVTVLEVTTGMTLVVTPGLVASTEEALAGRVG
jgi:hypothetical protein